MNAMECESHSSSEENTDELKKQQSKQEGKKKRTYEQKFCNAWLSNANFKGWIQETKGTNGNSVPYCKVCKVKLSCSKTALTRHMKGKGHTEACEMTAELRKWHLNIGELLGATDKSVAKLEIKLCSFIVEHNLPIQLSDDLLALLSSLFPSNKTVQKATLGKQKAINVIRQVLGFNTQKDSIDGLKSRKFPLIIDETTDRSHKNQLAVLVTYFNPGYI